MLYNIGEVLFRIGIAVTIAYFIVYSLAVATGVPVSRELAEAHSMIAALQGKVGGLTGTIASSLGAYAGFYVITGLIRYFTGRNIEIESGRVQGLFMFIGLYTVSFSGITALVKLFADYIAWSVPPLSGVSLTLRFIGESISTITLTYFIAVKVFGIPTF